MDERFKQEMYSFMGEMRARMEGCELAAREQREDLVRCEKRMIHAMNGVAKRQNARFAGWGAGGGTLVFVIAEAARVLWFAA